MPDLYGKPFESVDQAVSAVHGRLLWLSEKYNIEMNVNFYTGTGDAASSYFIGKAVTDFKHGSVFPNSLQVGAGNGKWVAIWHIHPGGPEALIGDFSTADVSTAVMSKPAQAMYVSYTAPIVEPSIHSLQLGACKGHL